MLIFLAQELLLLMFLQLQLGNIPLQAIIMHQMEEEL